MTNFFYNNSSNVFTSKIVLFLFLFILVFIPYLIVFLLVGEINLLKLNWIKIATENNSYIFNMNILYIIIGIIGLSILSFLIFKFLFKLVNYDAIPFIFMTHVICITTIVSGLIPYTTSNFVYIIIARFFIVIVSSLIIFFITNYITNIIMANSSNAYDYYKKFKEENLKQKEFNDVIKHLKDDNEKDYVEIEKD